MKSYDFDKAQRTIYNLQPLGLKQAVFGMEEDWHLTADTIWTKEDDFHLNFTVKEIMGISSSDWATPTLRLIFTNNIIQDIPCYKEEE
jgi:hypothetical protein